MKKYNIQNYVRYKNDLETVLLRNENLEWGDMSRDQLVAQFMPLVENLARKFSTSDQASGVMSINDLIQEGNYGLVAAVDKSAGTKYLTLKTLKKQSSHSCQKE